MRFEQPRVEQALQHPNDAERVLMGELSRLRGGDRVPLSAIRRAANVAERERRRIELIGQKEEAAAMRRELPPEMLQAMTSKRGMSGSDGAPSAEIAFRNASIPDVVHGAARRHRPTA